MHENLSATSPIDLPRSTHMSRMSSTRRDFLKHSAVAAGTLAALQTGLVHSASVSAGSDPEDRPDRLRRTRHRRGQRLLECGEDSWPADQAGRGGRRFRGPRPAVAQPPQEGMGRRRSTFRTTGSSSAWTPIRRPSIAASTCVLMATPPGFRPLHYAAAVKAGKHVFMEKPLLHRRAGLSLVGRRPTRWPTRRT